MRRAQRLSHRRAEVRRCLWSGWLVGAAYVLAFLTIGLGGMAWLEQGSGLVYAITIAFLSLEISGMALLVHWALRP